MIKPEELMIGNYFLPTSNGEILMSSGPPMRVGEVLFDKVRVIEYDREDSPEYKFSEIFGVPLTSEMLQQAGFKYNKIKGVASLDDDGDGEEFTHYWEISVKGNEQVGSFGFSLVKWGKDEKYTFSYHFLRIQIEYVHTLQNIYQSITGNKLPFKL